MRNSVINAGVDRPAGQTYEKMHDKVRSSWVLALWRPKACGIDTQSLLHQLLHQLHPAVLVVVQVAALRRGLLDALQLLYQGQGLCCWLLAPSELC